MKRTYSNIFYFKCRGLVTVEDLFTHFYSGWPHFLQGFLIGVIMATKRPWSINVGTIKIRKVEYAGMEEKGETKVNIQTTLYIEGREKKLERGKDDELIDKAKDDVQELVKSCSDFFQKSFLNSLPGCDSCSADEDDEDEDE
jgi:hypothetical protein